jgi:type II secretory pathway component PulJ
MVVAVGIFALLLVVTFKYLPDAYLSLRRQRVAGRTQEKK